MSPSTPAYRAVPISPPSTFSTPDTLVNPSPRSGPSHDDREKPHSRYPSASARMRVRPLPIILGILGFILLAGPIMHPTPRNALHTYLHAHTAPPPYDGAQPPTGGLDPAVVPMTLEARLSYLMDRPALDHPMAELPSRYGCPSLTYNRDWYFFHNEKKGQWEHLTGGDVLRYRNKLVEYLRTVEREGGKLVWEDGMDSHVPSAQRRGLIFTAGDGPALERLKLTLHMLRNVVKSKIITHIYHFKGELEEPGLKDGFAEKYDVQFIEVGGRRQNGKSWNIKNIAFLNTQFTEFVYMDSDNIPLGDPLDLFDSVEYQQSGSVFWSDLNKDHPDNFIWRVLGRACSDIHWPAEAGQLIFDKRGNNGLNLAVLHLSAHMMAEEEMYGQLGYGDKDTFRYSFYMLGLDYQMAPRQFASAGGYQDDQGVSSEEFCGHTMLQWGLTPPSKRYDPSYHPRPMFLHTILAKHRYNLQPEKLFTHYKRPRLDGMTEPTLVRTYYEWTGSCFAIDLKGPDGAPGTKMGWGDGQGVELEPLAELIGDKFVYDELQGISRTFVNIAH